jgi:hypothetical protein
VAAVKSRHKASEGTEYTLSHKMRQPLAFIAQAKHDRIRVYEVFKAELFVIFILLESKVYL